MPRKEPAQELALRPPAAGVSLSRWVYAEVRAAIIEGRLRPGARLPSTRNFCQQYRLARGTVVSAFEQLVAEGYLESRTGSGTRVASNLPERYFRAPHQCKVSAPRGTTMGKLSRWGEGLSTPFRFELPAQIGRAFQVYQPALDLFPTTVWSQLAGRRLRRAPRLLLNGVEAAGYGPLREAVAAYLGSARGVQCRAEQVFIVSGTQQTLDLIARLLVDPGDEVWVEDPGYIGAVTAFRAAGAKVVGMPVDEAGVQVAAGQRLAPRARAAYITPAHEFPMGMSLTLERRLALLQWAQASGAWIFEDDYDSEYRFVGRPLPSVQGLDDSGCVIFSGSFNKMLFPALRLGYVVLPERLIEPFTLARALTDRYAPVLDQAVLCDFITEGYFGQHIRRMREAYAERLAALHEAGDGPLAGLLEIVRIQAGLQTAALLPRECRDTEVAAAAAAAGVEAVPLSIFQISRRDINGLMLGFASAPPPEIRAGAERLARVLRSFTPRRAPKRAPRRYGD